jgi:hypothetical protein
MAEPRETMKEFKLIVAGGRDFSGYEQMSKILFDLANETYVDYAISIVSGMANGADFLGYLFAKEHQVQVYEYRANWTLYGKRAGFMRNEQMGDFADGLLAFWDGASRGTRHMINYMNKLNKPVHVIEY